MEQIFFGLMGLITLIVFFVMSFNLGNIRKNVQSMQRILSSWSEETGYGITFTCKQCHKTYQGKLPKCPHCGEERKY